MAMRLSLEALQRIGFPMGAEELAALDLVDTLVTVVEPASDLMIEPARAEAWWQLQADRLPVESQPDPVATRRLRYAVRDLLDAHLEHRAPRPTSIDDLNAAAAGAPVSLRLSTAGGQARVVTRWHSEHGGHPALAAIAREVITLLADPERLALLRRCANPDCSMLFLAHNRRRVWCAANICGNRARVARHYERAHPGRSSGRSDG